MSQLGIEGRQRTRSKLLRIVGAICIAGIVLGSVAFVYFSPKYSWSASKRDSDGDGYPDSKDFYPDIPDLHHPFLIVNRITNTAGSFEIKLEYRGSTMDLDWSDVTVRLSDGTSAIHWSNFTAKDLTASYDEATWSCGVPKQLGALNVTLGITDWGGDGFLNFFDILVLSPDRESFGQDLTYTLGLLHEPTSGVMLTYDLPKTGFVCDFESTFSPPCFYLHGTPHIANSSLYHSGQFSYVAESDLEVIGFDCTGIFDNQYISNQTGRLTVWMFDPGPGYFGPISLGPRYQDNATIEVDDLWGHHIIMGVFGPSGDYPAERYKYRVGADNFTTNESRTPGWHCFEIVVSWEQSVGYIDGFKVFETQDLTSIHMVYLGDWWADGVVSNHFAFDDVSITAF